MLYTGDATDRCAISFTPVCDIEQPVGFESAHAYECECIVEWITKRSSSNPITGETIPPFTPVTDVLRPLIIQGDAHVASTQATLERAGKTVGVAPPVHWVEKFAWDLVFSAMFLIGNYWLENLAVNICLLFWSIFLTNVHYSVTGPWVVLTVIIAFVVSFVMACLNSIQVLDVSILHFFQLLTLEIFSVKVSLDVVTTLVGLDYC